MPYLRALLTEDVVEQHFIDVFDQQKTDNDHRVVRFVPLQHYHYAIQSDSLDGAISNTTLPFPVCGTTLQFKY